MAKNGLHIIIIGGGLAGLCCAIALRRSGHRVQVFEQSRFANEIGAAIHMTPNATGVLRQIGIDPRDSGAVLLDQVD
jgi:2-polyprenyl-6-methoxyphenol hydroxylase-like FAD-dependent oxidoreductase